MSKIIGILMLVVIGGTQLIVAGIAWVLSMIYLLATEIIGTKKFVKKFHKLNKIVTDEFLDIIKVFKDYFEGSNI